MHKLFSLAAVCILAATVAACSTLRQEVTCDRAKAVARVALEGLAARCPTGLAVAPAGQLPPADLTAEPAAPSRADAPPPHPRT